MHALCELGGDWLHWHLRVRAKKETRPTRHATSFATGWLTTVHAREERIVALASTLPSLMPTSSLTGTRWDVTPGVECARAASSEWWRGVGRRLDAGGLKYPIPGVRGVDCLLGSAL